MIEVKKSKPYTSKVVGKAMLTIDETKSAFKVYFVDIVGRQDRKRHEWDYCGRTREEFIDQLRKLNPEGIGFVTAFPHITKVFTFGPAAETNLYTNAFKTATLEELPLDYSSATEVGCAAEIMIAREEFKLWLDAQTVDEYLAKTTDAGAAAFANHGKLYERFAS